MPELSLGRGLVALIDCDDVERVAGRRWYACAPDPNYPESMYAYSKTYKPGRKTGVMVWLHRFLLNCPAGMQVDHVDRNGLNNRRSNLRVCTQAQNCANSGTRIGQSGFRGVQKERRRFVALIYIDGAPIRIGNFDCPVEAAIARDKAAIEAYGEFATLNFPRAA